MLDTKDLLHQINNENLSAPERARLRCRLSKQLEQTGNYDAARDALGDLWRGFGEPPCVEGLDTWTTGDVFLRAGSTTAWIGSIRAVEGSQEAAKNLITESIAFFQSLGDTAKIAEAQAEIALCYERQGRLDEARVYFSQARETLDDSTGDVKAVVVLRAAVLEAIANRLSDALAILRSGASLFESSDNHTLRGSFHNELAIVQKRLGVLEARSDYLDQALLEYTAAAVHFEAAKHSRYQACVENNLAMLYLRLSRFTEAHEHLDRAQALFTRLNDQIHLAQVEETRAQTMLAEGNITKAETVISAAVRMLRQTEDASLLADALTTQGVILARLGKTTAARAHLTEAITLAENAGDKETAGVACLTLLENALHELSDEELSDTLDRAKWLLSPSKDVSLKDRLIECAYRALVLFRAVKPDWTNFSLQETVHRQEARFIRMALEESNGVLSQAARLLGLSGHQSLGYILTGRHKALGEEFARKDESPDETV